jgi:hypothetical protein
MTTVEPQNRKDILSSIFRRRGANGTYTRLFDSLEVLQKERLLAAIELRDEELPIIGSMPNVDNCALLTTRRLVWYFEGARRCVLMEDIRDVVADFDKHNYGRDTKQKLNELIVVTMDGGKYLITLEPGASLFWTWNVLKNVGSVNRNRVARIPT